MNFEQIYKKNFPSIYRLFYYKFVPQHAIEDLSHDTFIRFHDKYLSRNLTDQEVTKILFGIGNNVYKEWIKKIIKLNETEFKEDYHIGFDFEDFVNKNYELTTRIQLKKNQRLFNNTKSEYPRSDPL